MSSRTLNYLLLLIILGLIIALILVLNMAQKPNTNNEYFLVNFDKADFNRLEELVSRFKQNEGDVLMIIPPILDGGHWIHDVISNGREIQWIVDRSRDGMSANRGKTEFSCQEIDMIETEIHFTFELSRCQNYDSNMRFPMVSFLKEELD